MRNTDYYIENKPQRICPFCGEDNITDWNSESIDDGVVVWATCPTCGKEWGVCYSLVFDGNIVED